MVNKAIRFYAQLFFLSVAGGVIIQKPLNVAASARGQTVLNCSSDTVVLTWLYTANCNPAGGMSLTDNNCDVVSNYASHYRTEKPGGFVCNLIVFDALLSLGGCYVCADGYGTGRQYQAMLIIIDSNANITSNSTDIVTGEDVMISSIATYRGPSIPYLPPPLPPSFYWTLQSDPNHNITSYQGLTTNTSASSYIIVTAQKPDVPPFMCNLFFNPPVVVPAGCASNAPIYSASWVTSTFPVSYPPENLVIAGIPNPCLHEAVELICSASGYPIPTYKWFNLTNGVVLSVSNTVIIESGGSYQCVATNIIRNVLYNASTSVYVSDCESPRNVSISGTPYPCLHQSVELLCSASGYPLPTYSWFDLTNGAVFSETNAVTLERGGFYECVASNTIRNVPYNASSVVNVYDCDNLDDTEFESHWLRGNSST